MTQPVTSPPAKPEPSMHIRDVWESIPTVKELHETHVRRKGHNLPMYDPFKGSNSQGSEAHLSKGLRLVEVFDSIQGEGVNCGEPMTFVRFSRCNISCEFCDTPYNRMAYELSEDELLSNLIARNPKWVLFTGGEPMLQLPRKLVENLGKAGIKTTCESNGMVWNESFLCLDHVTISPKLYYSTNTDPIPLDKILSPNLINAIRTKEMKLHELRYLIAGTKDDIFRLPGDIHTHAEALILSPLMMDLEPSDSFVSGKGHTSPFGTVEPDSFRRCMALVMKYRHINARMSVQVHKLIGVR